MGTKCSNAWDYGRHLSLKDLWLLSEIVCEVSEYVQVGDRDVLKELILKLEQSATLGSKNEMAVGHLPCLTSQCPDDRAKVLSVFLHLVS